MAVSEAQVLVRALGASDGLAAVTVVNTAAEWYAEFLPASEVNEPEMTLDSWAGEARRMTWYGAFEGGELVAVTRGEVSTLARRQTSTRLVLSEPAICSMRPHDSQ